MAEAALCGAETRTCGCGHPQARHARTGTEGTRRGACAACQCTAFAGVPCDRPPGTGRGGRCHRHGGRSLHGETHPRFTPGIYSARLPRGVKHDYERALADDQLLSLRHEIALLRAYSIQLASTASEQAWGTASAGQRMQRLLDTWDRYLNTEGATSRQATRAEVSARIEELRETVQAARAETKARAELRETVSALERLSRSENTRVVELYSMISAERAFALRQAETTILLQALDDLVQDRDLRNAIRRRVATKFAELAGRRDAPTLDAGRGPSEQAGDTAAAHGTGAGGLAVANTGSQVPE